MTHRKGNWVWCHLTEKRFAFCFHELRNAAQRGDERTSLITRTTKSRRELRMDTLLNIRAFLATVQAGSLSGASRVLGVAPSVVSKRVARLEDELRAQLFVRTNREVSLTESAERYMPRLLEIVNEVDDVLSGARASHDKIEGHLRIKCPTTLATKIFGGILSDFQTAYPNLSIDLVLIDRSVNPVEEGFDVAIGALPSSYAKVVDVPIAPMPVVLCATPSYLERRGKPSHPRDLLRHNCLTFTAYGGHWSFVGPCGALDIQVHPYFSTNDTELLHQAALKGLGVLLSSEIIAAESLAKGLLEPLLPDYPVEELWLKALVPESKMKWASVRALLSWIKERTPPFDRSNIVASDANVCRIGQTY